MRGIGVAVIIRQCGSAPACLSERPLADAEFVLLVDHHQPQPGEFGFRLHDGLRADHHVDLAGRDPCCKASARPPPRHAAGQQPQPHSAPGEQSPERADMLPGENFRRSHQRRLMPVGHGQQNRVDRHHRLAAAHVPLQKPVHRRGPGHVGRDLANHLLLPGCQLEGKQPADAGVDPGVGRQRRRAGRGSAAIAASPPTPVAE